MGIKVWIALIGVFASFVLLVQGMGYVAFYLSPRRSGCYTTGIGI